MLTDKDIAIANFLTEHTRAKEKPWFKEIAWAVHSVEQTKNGKEEAKRQILKSWNCTKRTMLSSRQSELTFFCSNIKHNSFPASLNNNLNKVFEILDKGEDVDSFIDNCFMHKEDSCFRAHALVGGRNRFYLVVDYAMSLDWPETVVKGTTAENSCITKELSKKFCNETWYK